MRQRIFFFLLITTNFLFSQNRIKEKDEELFEKARLIHNILNEDYFKTLKRKKLDTTESSKKLIDFTKKYVLNLAKEKYQEIIDKHKNSPFYYRALNNIAYLYLDLNERREAITIFKEILTSRANDKEKGGIGSGLMSEPYTNYKNRASKMLAHIYIEDSNYIEALKYLDSTKEYPYQHFCGNEYSASEIYIATQYIKCYLALNNYQKAYETALPHILENGISDNSYLLELGYIALLKQYSIKQLKEKFEISIKNVYVEHKTTKKGRKYSLEFINYLSQKIYLNGTLSRAYDKNQKEFEEKCLKSKFYNLISNTAVK